MKEGKVLYMTDPKITLANKMKIAGDIVILSHSFVSALSDGEFIVMCGMDVTFKCDQKTTDLIKSRMFTLGMKYGVKSTNQISTKNDTEKSGQEN